MKRREFIAGLAAVLSASGRAWADNRPRLLGALVTPQTRKQILEAVLRDRGWNIGRDLQIEYRVSNGDTEETRMRARELLSLKPDALFAATNTCMAALQAERSTVPTVFAMVSDPISMHYVESFSKPGGNVTGFTPFEPSLGGKWVSLLKEVAPQIKHIGLIYNPEPGNNSAEFRKSIDQVAQTTGILSVRVPAGDSSDVDRLISSLKTEPDSGLIFLPDLLTSVRRNELTELVARCRLPAVYPLRMFCEAGGLMSYGVDIDKIYVGAASYVDRILRGVSPSELPVQAPTEFELIINQKTAKQLGLALPSTLLARADAVIE